MITLVYNINQTEDGIEVKAVVEDMVQIYAQTMEDPAEYGPALCEATFSLEDGEFLPEDEEELLEYLESLDLDWKVLSEDWDY
jgi:hypothetical protein